MQHMTVYICPNAFLPHGQGRNCQAARAEETARVQTRWTALPLSLNHRRAVPGPDPPSFLSQCCYHAVPAWSLKSHPRRVLATKNTPGHFQIWNGAPWSPSEFQAVLFLGRSAVPPLLPYPGPPSRFPKQSNPCVASSGPGAFVVR